MFRLLVCGGRNYSDSKQFKGVLAEIWKKHGQNVFLCSGGATEADTMAYDLAEVVGWDRVSYPRKLEKVRGFGWADSKPANVNGI